MAEPPNHIFLAGVPATGKTWLGSWLATHHGYKHIDAEKDGGRDFDTLGVHQEWDAFIQTGRPDLFVSALDALGPPIVINWGFPPHFLYVVQALQAEGFEAWWIQADRSKAREAFIRRGGIDPRCYDHQMDLIAQHWRRIAQVFGNRIVAGLNKDGSQKHPEKIWAKMRLAV